MPDNLIYAGSRHRIRRWRNYGITSSPPIAPVEFLFRDDFLTNEVAPLTSPRTAEPGPGTGTILDTGNNLSISGNLLTGVTPVGTGDPRITAQSISRATGLAALYLGTSSLNRIYVGWDDNGVTDILQSAFQVTVGTLRAWDNVVLIALPGITTNAYDFLLALRTLGAFFLIRGQEFSDWTLVWPGNIDATASPIPAISWSVDTATVDSFRVSQLPSPWDTDFGIATDRLAGARGAGDRYTHEADFIGEFIVTTVPGAGTIFWTFREQDATNYWEVIIEPSQDLTLREVVAGVPVARGVAVGVVNNGDRIVVIAEGTTIRVYEQNTLRITYALAANFQTETDGELLAIGTGAVDDIVTWPRVLSGAALRALNRVADA